MIQYINIGPRSAVARAFGKCRITGRAAYTMVIRLIFLCRNGLTAKQEEYRDDHKSRQEHSSHTERIVHEYKSIRRASGRQTLFSAIFTGKYAGDEPIIKISGLLEIHHTASPCLVSICAVNSTS